MIRLLTGHVIEIGENWVVVDVHGIGYLVATPTLKQTFTKNSSVTLYTHLAVRETALDLYGFLDKEHLHMFELIIGVPKVGPKSALQVMASASPTLLAEAAHKNDPDHLHKLSGIGKKTCENIILYLNKKLDEIPAPSTIHRDNLNQVQTDAIDALIALGYDSALAREAILDLANEESTVNSLVTQALKQIN